MSVMERARKLAQEGKQREAITAIERAGHEGDGEALLTLAHWRLFGVYGPRNLAAGRQLIEKAAFAGNLEAARIHAFMVGNGTGSRSDPAGAAELLAQLREQDPIAALQLDLLPRMLSIEAATELPAEIVSQDPPVRVIRGLLLEAECRHLTALASPALRTSSVIDPRTGSRVPHPVRTSMGMSFGPLEEDLVVHAINRRLAAVTGTEVSWGEPLQILRYSPGQEYKPHVDALPGASNQRTWTVLVYLNEDYSGGETRFTELDLSVRGKQGDGLIFRNMSADGRADHRMRHAGRPVTSGVKWLASRWIRAAPYDPWNPK